MPSAPRCRFAAVRAALTAISVLVGPSTALAFVHDWHMTEIYSNADGSIQFVELATQSPGETLLSLAVLQETAFGHSFSPGTDLAGSTAGRSLLFATPGFAALPGAVAPDFTLPSGFFDPAGDTLQWIALIDGGPYAGGPTIFDSLAFEAGVLPLEGGASLHRALGSTTLFVAASSPMNFAGQTGSLVPEPHLLVLLVLAVAGLSARARALAARQR